MSERISHPPTSTVGTELIRYCRERLMTEYYPRIERCVNELSQDDIWWRAHESDNSIGNLLLHLRGNIGQWIVTGLGGAPDQRQRDREFSERSNVPKADLLKAFKDTLDAADKVLSEFDPALLLEVRHIQRYDVTCLEAITHVVEHVAQHLGQIIYVTKLRTGKDLKFYNL